MQVNAVHDAFEGGHTNNDQDHDHENSKCNDTGSDQQDDWN